jgi:predicted phage tail protein
MWPLRSVVCALLVLLATSAAAQVTPGAPQNLTQAVTGTTVTLTWSAPGGGVAPTGYLVEASVVPSGPLVASLPVAATALTVPNVPPGVYYVRVRALNGGAQSAPSNEVTVSVGGSSGCPAPPLPPQIVVRATGLNVTVGWSSSGGCAPTSYVVQAGSAPGLTNIAQVNMGAQTGLAAVAPAGTYYIRVIGTNAFGSAVSDELTARVAVNNVTDTIAPFDFLFFDITLTQTGTYQGTLVWNDPTIDLDLYLATAGCPYPPTGCTVAISDSSVGNTEVVSTPVTAGQTYRVFVDNFTNRTTSFTITNAVFAGATTAAAASPPRQ